MLVSLLNKKKITVRVIGTDKPFEAQLLPTTKWK